MKDSSEKRSATRATKRGSGARATRKGNRSLFIYMYIYTMYVKVGFAIR